MACMQDQLGHLGVVCLLWSHTRFESGSGFINTSPLRSSTEETSATGPSQVRLAAHLRIPLKVTCFNEVSSLLEEECVASSFPETDATLATVVAETFLLLFEVTIEFKQVSG